MLTVKVSDTIDNVKSIIQNIENIGNIPRKDLHLYVEGKHQQELDSLRSIAF